MYSHNCSKWDGLLRPRVVTTTRTILGKIAHGQDFTLIFTKPPYDHPRVTSSNLVNLTSLSPILWEEIPNISTHKQIEKYSKIKYLYL